MLRSNYDRGSKRGYVSIKWIYGIFGMYQFHLVFLTSCLVYWLHIEYIDIRERFGSTKHPILLTRATQPSEINGRYCLFSANSGCVADIIKRLFHDEAIKWKHFPRYWHFVQGILIKRLNKQSRRRWLDKSSRSLWRHCNVHHNLKTNSIYNLYGYTTYAGLICRVVFQLHINGSY